MFHTEIVCTPTHYPWQNYSRGKFDTKRSLLRDFPKLKLRRKSSQNLIPAPWPATAIHHRLHFLRQRFEPISPEDAFHIVYFLYEMNIFSTNQLRLNFCQSVYANKSRFDFIKRNFCPWFWKEKLRFRLFRAKVTNIFSWSRISVIFRILKIFLVSYGLKSLDPSPVFKSKTKKCAWTNSDCIKCGTEI